MANVDYREVDALHRSISKRTPYEANRTLAVLSRMFSVAIRWKWRTDNPCKGIERNDEAKRRRYLSSGRVAAAHQGVCGAPRAGGGGHLPAVAVDRRKEGRSSFREVGAIRPENRHIDQAGAATSKQRTEHIVPLSAPARQLLANRKRTTEFVFPGIAGGHEVEVKESWAAICKVAEIANLRMHDLRHSYASHLASAGVGLHTRWSPARPYTARDNASLRALDGRSAAHGHGARWRHPERQSLCRDCAAQGRTMMAHIQMSLDEYAAALVAIERAVEFGDYGPLLDRLRSTATLLGMERNAAADIIAGKLKRPRGQRVQPRTQTRELILALAVSGHMHQGKPEKAAVELVRAGREGKQAGHARRHREAPAHVPMGFLDVRAPSKRLRASKSRFPCTKTC